MVKKFLQVPELMVGFDTETTGLDVSVDRAISYGFCAYRYGRSESSEHFYVLPDRPISDGARRVHGLSAEHLHAMRATHEVLTVEEGLRRATRILRDFHQRGAYIVGANVARFDLEMLRRSHRLVMGDVHQHEMFDLSTLRIIDVIEHDLVIEASRVVRSRRGLGHLCAHYGVVPGGHDALNDARAAVEVFAKQVLHNSGGQMALEFLASP